MGWITATPIFLWKLFCLFVIYPATVIIELLRFGAQLIAWSPWFAIALVLWGAGSLTSNYGNVIIQEVDYTVRCLVHPVVENFVGPLLDLLRTIYNPTICVWDALNWFVYGYFNSVLVPDAACASCEAENAKPEYFLKYCSQSRVLAELLPPENSVMVAVEEIKR